MDKIDTQGMSAPADPNYKGPVRIQPHKPWSHQSHWTLDEFQE